MMKLNRFEQAVIRNRRMNRETWRDLPESEWLRGLTEEFAELVLALNDEHPGPVEHELSQIAGICINWLEYRDENEPG